MILPHHLFNDLTVGLEDRRRRRRRKRTIYKDKRKVEG